MKGRETFYGDHTVPITSCSEVNQFWSYDVTLAKNSITFRIDLGQANLGLTGGFVLLQISLLLFL